MSLHGTLDSFPLADVLRFLAGAQRSGVLQVDGDRGTVRLWLEDGECTGAECGGSVVDDAVPATVEALRFVGGTFSLDEAGTTPRRLHSRPLSVVLAEALDLRAEWDSIELVLPSTRHRVRPVPTPPDGRAVLDPLGWRLVTSLGRSDDVGSVVARSGVGELDAARALVALVRDGLLVVESPGAPVAQAAEVVPGDTADPVVPSVVVAADPFVEAQERFPIDDLLDSPASFDALVDPPANDRAPVASSAADAVTAFSPDAASAVAEVVASGGAPAPTPVDTPGSDPAFR